MGVFDRLKHIAAARKDLGEFGVDPFNVPLERIISATEGVIDGRRTILAGTNNYLGLTFNHECIAAARTALEQEGTGTTGSRMANGSFSGHMALERELSEFFGRRSTIIFPPAISPISASSPPWPLPVRWWCWMLIVMRASMRCRMEEPRSSASAITMPMTWPSVCAAWASAQQTP